LYKTLFSKLAAFPEGFLEQLFILYVLTEQVPQNLVCELQIYIVLHNAKSSALK
jgi:hypothetical protein